MWYRWVMRTEKKLPDGPLGVLVLIGYVVHLFMTYGCIFFLAWGLLLLWKHRIY